MDRGNRPPPADVVDVRRRHHGAAACAAPAGDGPRAPALRTATPSGRSRPAARAPHLLPVPDRSGVSPDGREPGREPAGERHLWRLDLRHPAGRARADVVRGHRAAVPRRHRPVARSFVPDVVARHRRSRHRVGPRPPRRWRRPTRRARHRLPRDRGAGPAARLYPRADLAHLPPRHRRRRPDHPADQDSRRRRLVRAAGDSPLHPRRSADGIRRDLGTHRRFGDGHRRQGARRPGDGGGRRRDPFFRHLGIDCGRRLRD